MKNVLIIGENIKEINKLRRVFGFEFKVSATNSPDNAVGILQNKANDLAVYHASDDLSPLFSFYRSLRGNASTEKMPLLVIANTMMLKALTDIVEMTHAAVIGENLSEDEMTGVINSMLN
jgi:PleD family two-component response regulator